MKIILTLLLCACMSVAFADQVYRWVDKDGHVHYSQTPPDPTGVQNAQNLVQQMQVQNQQAQAAQQQAQQEAQKQAQQQQRCNQLNAQLQILKQVNVVATVDAQGSKTYLSDAQHEQQEQQLQDEINKECSGQQ